MTGTVLERSLRRVIIRLKRLRILRLQTVSWLLMLIPAVALALSLPAAFDVFPVEFPILLLVTILGIVLSRLMTKLPSLHEAARLVEQTHSNLDDAVITAVEVSQRTEQRPSVLSAMVVHDADQLAKQSDWSRAVSGGSLAAWTLLSLLSFVVMASGVMAASRYGRNLIQPSDNIAAINQSQKAVPVTQLVIEPGDTEIERGSALTVVAKFPDVIPTKPVLEFVDSQRIPRQLAMTETVDTGVYAGRMEGILSDGTYRVLYAESSTAPDRPSVSSDFRVTTFVRPKLEQVDAVVTPPAWSGRTQETIEDVMRMTVTEGSTVVLKLRLNKPVATAVLHPKTGPKLVLVPASDDPSLLETTIVASESNAWTVKLQDSAGRTPIDDEQILIRVSRNEPAKLKATFPGKDTNVSPLQEFLVEANATDDFGIVDFGIQYSLSGHELQEITLNHAKAGIAAISDPAAANSASDTATPQQHPAVLNTVISHQIDLESLNAAPDDMVTYSFWASDIAPDGSPRRSYSDIMFAEVRRFEDIFRESQQAGEQQQQQNQQQQQKSAADDVLKLQKEIISATWNTIRAEATKRADGTLIGDVGVIAASQGHAIEQLKAAMQELADDPKTTALAEQALTEMESAKQELQSVRDGKESSTLGEALQLENTVAYTLLRMRASEFQVQQQQQSGGGGGGGSASQQQLQQLELDNKRNRYETEKQAKQKQEKTQQQREQVQVLNRLKELARRQQMVNERLKQLESELRTATTDEEREEIERELKRLRDEQREMLRDVDELSERMQQATDPQKPVSAPLRQQLEQARENVQQASRSMDEGKLAEAISEGTRAERKFEQLKEEFRNQTSSQFDEAMRDLRDQAQELSRQQEELARQLANEEPPKKQQPDGVPAEEESRRGDSGNSQQKKQPPSLRAGRDRQQLQKSAGEQRDRLNRVVEQTKQIVEQAEQIEPLLSNKLYDTLRDLKDSKPDEALQATELLTSRGMWTQSQQAEQAARIGIQQLKEGIEKAADSILGSQAESLRQAQSQLQDATEKLASEIQNATGEEREPGGGDGGNENVASPPSEGASQQPGEKQKPGESQKPGKGSSSSEGPAEKQTESGADPKGGSQGGSEKNESSSLLGGGREDKTPGGGQNQARPLTGNNFTEWSDQLRDVEEMLDDPELRNRVAQVRDRAKTMRAEYKRHGEEPKWDLVKSQLLNEMQSLEQRIAQELAKRDSDRAMVPIDREPVPEQFDSLVQKYYELLGRERDAE